MTIKSRLTKSLPATLMEMKDGKPTPVKTTIFFAARKWRCSRCPAPSPPPARPSIVPGFVNNYDALKAKGVDAIACVLGQ